MEQKVEDYNKLTNRRKYIKKAEQKEEPECEEGRKGKEGGGREEAWERKIGKISEELRGSLCNCLLLLIIHGETNTRFLCDV